MVKEIRCDFCKQIIKDYYIIQVWNKNYATKLGSKRIARYDVCDKCYKEVIVKYVEN